MPASVNNKRGRFVVCRSLLDDPLWLSEPFTRGQAWVDLLGLASHNQSEYWVRGIRVELKRGDVGRSEVHLAKRWMWSRGKVRRFLAALETDHQIVQQNSNVSACIRICNYDDYQFGGTADGTPDDTPNSTASSTPNGTADGTGNEKLRTEERKKEDPPLKVPPAGDIDRNEPAKPKPKTYKTWTEAEFRAECNAANHDELLQPAEVDDFVAYWLEASTTGRTRLQMEKTWDTRRRMQTAVRMIFEHQRNGGTRRYVSDLL